MATPLLSIAMIFRNDIRSIERCLKALQPLRDAAPCELVMADTGSTDGSRAIAEQYADILFDFPWIDDFAAARNAVMDRCSGVWCLILDTDEYLDENVNELVTFLCTTDEQENPLGVVTVRNYDTYDMDGEYSDFLGSRIVRMSTGVRYKGAVHEHFDFHGEINACSLPNTILHHDGYVATYDKNNEAGKVKTERNTRLIRKELEKDPDNLALRLQLIEAIATTDAPEYVDLLRQTIKLIREKQSIWDKVGPPILRYAVYAAEQKNLPEWDEWLQMAEEWFPDSLFTRLDVEFTAFVHAWNAKKDFKEALRRGNRYLKALEDFRNGADPMAQMYSTFQTAKPTAECLAKVHMVSAYCSQNQVEAAFELAKTVDYAKLNGEQMARFVACLQDIHYRSTLDTAPVITQLWELISDPEQPAEKTDAWKKALFGEAGRTFVPENCKAERKKKDFVRYAYTLYLPLHGKNTLGLAASVMELEDADGLENLLTEVEDWKEFSIHALIHALKCGARFPLPGKPMCVEEMDALASRCASNKDELVSLALREARQSNLDDMRKLLWARGLVMSAVRAYPWDDKERDEDKGLELARAFARVEGRFLPRCYAPEALQEDMLFMLPPMHRFGWYCSQAFEQLDRGDFAACVQKLRDGLSQYSNAASMVDFLLDQVAGLERNTRIAAAPPELVALAEQVKVILARFAPDDPAVMELKSSPVYQQVAWLIETPAQPAFGTIMQ